MRLVAFAILLLGLAPAARSQTPPATRGRLTLPGFETYLVDETAPTQAPCPLNGLRAELQGVHEGSCGRLSCGVGNTVMVREVGRTKPLLFISSSARHEELPLGPLSVACRGRFIEVQVEDSELLRVPFNPKTRTFAFEPPARALLDAAWKAAPEKEPASRAQVRIRLLDTVPMLAPALKDSARLLVARAHLAAGDWASAEDIIESAKADRVHQPQLRRQLDALRAQATALHVVERRKIGHMAPPGFTGVEPNATIFWRGQTLCVGQDDPAPDAPRYGPTDAHGKGIYPPRPRTMRCYELTTQAWGPHEPYAPPSDDPRFAHRCTDRDSPWRDLGPINLPCHVPENAHAQQWVSGRLAGVQGPALIYRELPPSGEATLRFLDAAGSRTVTREEVTRMLLDGPGSKLLADAEFVLSGSWAARWDRPQQAWPLDTPEHDWSGILTSPDQRWIAAIAASPTPGTLPELWLVRVERLAR